MTAKPLLKDPTRLLELIEALRNTEDDEVPEPQHSPPTEPEDPATVGSRSTQPRDYLRPEEGVPKWLL